MNKILRKLFTKFRGNTTAVLTFHSSSLDWRDTLDHLISAEVTIQLSLPLPHRLCISIFKTNSLLLILLLSIYLPGFHQKYLLILLLVTFPGHFCQARSPNTTDRLIIVNQFFGVFYFQFGDIHKYTNKRKTAKKL